MYKKRLLTVLMAVLLLLCSITTIHADDKVGIDDVDHALNTVSNSLVSLSDTSSLSEAKALGDIFTSFVDIARTSGQILTAINGSVTFLRLLGIVSDPTQTKLDGIMSQLQNIDERLSSMDDKLNDLTTMMSELKASVEFNARTEKAILYENTWRDFEYRYMENGMDRLITQYNSMLRSGLQAWCNGNRNINNVDNSSIIIHYINNEGDYSISYTDENIVLPITTNDGYVVLKGSLIPQTFTYDVNNFNEKLEKELINRIKAFKNNPLSDDLVIINYPVSNIGDLSDDDISKIGRDAINTLVYRVASARVNNNETFAGEVRSAYSNYCLHLQNSGDGIDAILKTYFLTHAFEYSIADDLKDLCDRMIVLTGTYGMFASNVLGMSHLTTDDEKTNAISQMTSAIKMIEEASNNSITGNGNYCYITGTNLEYSTVEFSSSAKLVAHYTISNTTYKSYSGSDPKASYGNGNSSASPIGDVAMIILASTLACEGVTLNHDYLNDNLANNNVLNLGNIVTGYGGVQTFTIDGKTKLHVKNAFGDYFTNNSTITNLPEDAESEYVVYRKKISGSLYNLNTKALSSNATLCAIAAYGENHMFWITDEGGFMGGPYDNSAFKDSYTKTETGQDSTGKIREHLYEMSTSYNIILSTPSENLMSQLDDQYRPLVSLKEDMAYEYNQSVYEKEDIPQIDINNSNVNINGNLLSKSFIKDNTSDIIIKIFDEYTKQTTVKLLDEDGNKIIDLNVSKGSIIVTIKNDFIKTLSVGVHNYKLCINSSYNGEYTYDLQIIINNDNSNTNRIVVNTGVN